MNKLLKKYWPILVWFAAVLLQGFIINFPIAWLAALLVFYKKERPFFSLSFFLGILLDFLIGRHLGFWATIFILSSILFNFLKEKGWLPERNGRLNLPLR